MCVRESGEKIQTSLLRTHFSLYLIPSVLIMALSTTLPPSLEFLVARDIGLRKRYFHVSQALNCPNIFYSVCLLNCCQSYHLLILLNILNMSSYLYLISV